MHLEAAIERVNDAEEGAIVLLGEVDELMKQVQLTVANVAMLRKELEKAQRGSIIGFAIGGVSFGVGTPLIVEGVIRDNQTMLWTGVGIAGVGSLVWVMGRFVFKWW